MSPSLRPSTSDGGYARGSNSFPSWLRRQQTPCAVPASKIEGVLQLMAFDGRTISDFTSPHGIEILFCSNEEDYMSLVDVRYLAFGEPGTATAVDTARARSNVEEGGLAAIAIDTSTSEVVALRCLPCPLRRSDRAHVGRCASAIPAKGDRRARLPQLFRVLRSETAWRSST